MLVAEAGRAHRRDIRLGLRSATHAAVAEGLRQGERVIVYPPPSLADGARVADDGPEAPR